MGPGSCGTMTHSSHLGGCIYATEAGNTAHQDCLWKAGYLPCASMPQSGSEGEVSQLPSWSLIHFRATTEHLWVSEKRIHMLLRDAWTPRTCTEGVALSSGGELCFLYSWAPGDRSLGFLDCGRVCSISSRSWAGMHPFLVTITFQMVPLFKESETLTHII